MDKQNNYKQVVHQVSSGAIEVENIGGNVTRGTFHFKTFDDGAPHDVVGNFELFL